MRNLLLSVVVPLAALFVFGCGESTPESPPSSVYEVGQTYVSYGPANNVMGLGGKPLKNTDKVKVEQILPGKKLEVTLVTDDERNGARGTIPESILTKPEGW